MLMSRVRTGRFRDRSAAMGIALAMPLALRSETSRKGRSPTTGGAVTQGSRGIGRGYVVVVGKSAQKTGEALGVLRSAGFDATGTFDRQEALAAIAAHDRLVAVVAGGSVDEQLEADLRAAAEPKGGQVVRAHIGHGDPTRQFRDHVLPQLDQLDARQGRKH
jgi:hypothetical protein